MSFGIGLAIIVGLYVYGRLDRFFAAYEQYCDEQFMDAVAACDKDHLSNTEKEFLSFLIKNYDNKWAGLVLLMVSILSIPRALFGVMRTRGMPKNKSLLAAANYWAMSHFHRSTLLAIAGLLPLCTIKLITVIRGAKPKEIIECRSAPNQFYVADSVAARNFMKAA